jgi:pimeloyl-ACP methyl ester carboxylesterase
MNTINKPKELNQSRRGFLGNAAVILAAAELATIGSADAQSGTTRPQAVPPIKPGTNTSFASMKQIDAGLLSVGYAETGPADGPAVILLHGWPYDIHSFVDVAPLLASAGYRVVVPYLRGYGTTRFLSSETMRNAQQSAVGLDIIALMDALKIQTATVAGFDWGARTADVMATLWPERCKAIVSVSGYLISSPAGNQVPLPPEPAFLFWYQYYFSTPVGKAGYAKYLDQFNKFIWHQASPKCTTIAGGLAWPTASGNMTTSKSGWPHFLPSQCPRLPWKATPTAQSTRPARHIAPGSRANMSTASSPAASDTICRRKPPRLLPRR